MSPGDEGDDSGHDPLALIEQIGEFAHAVDRAASMLRSISPGSDEPNPSIRDPDTVANRLETGLDVTLQTLLDTLDELEVAERRLDALPLSSREDALLEIEHESEDYRPHVFLVGTDGFTIAPVDSDDDTAETEVSFDAMLTQFVEHESDDADE